MKNCEHKKFICAAALTVQLHMHQWKHAKEWPYHAEPVIPPQVVLSCLERYSALAENMGGLDVILDTT